MAIVKRENILYLNVTCGVMRNKKKEIETGGYEGYMIGIEEKHGDFEGKPTVQIQVKMQDPKSDEKCIIQFTKKSWYALSFFARIEKINIEIPFIVGVLGSDMNEKMSFCYLKQAGIKKVEADKTFPKYTTVHISGQDVQDWTEPFKRMDEIVAKLSTVLLAVSPAAESHVTEEGIKARTYDSQAESKAADDDDNDPPFPESDDLPF